MPDINAYKRRREASSAETAEFKHKPGEKYFLLEELKGERSPLKARFLALKMDQDACA